MLCKVSISHEAVKRSRDASELQEKRQGARQYPVEGVNSFTIDKFSFELNSRVSGFFFFLNK